MIFNPDYGLLIEEALFKLATQILPLIEVGDVC